MKNRATKKRRIELTTAQIKAVQNALNYFVSNTEDDQRDAITVAQMFDNLVEDVAITIVD